jgi:type I restriction enzyme S subunit
MTRPNLNAVAIVPANMENAIESTGFDTLRAWQIESSWIFYLTQTSEFVGSMSMLVQGALYPAVRPKDIRGHRIPIAPIQEQQRIIAEIEKQFTRLDAAFAALKRVQANLKRYRAAILKAACEGRLVPTEAELARREGRSYEPASELLKRILAERRACWEANQVATMGVSGKEPKGDKWKANYKEPLPPDPTNPPPIPEGWCWTNLLVLTSSDRGSIKTGPFGSLLKKHEHRTSGIPVFGIENIDRMRFVSGSKIHITPEKALELVDYDARRGDILISRSGTVGEVCVVPNCLASAGTGEGVLPLR